MLILSTMNNPPDTLRVGEPLEPPSPREAQQGIHMSLGSVEPPMHSKLGESALARCANMSAAEKLARTLRWAQTQRTITRTQGHDFDCAV